MSLTPTTLSPIEAYEELMRFAGKFGEAPLRLAFHAAVPQSFRLDLLHLIKRNFVPEAKNESTAEADLLLSPLCKDIGRGYFQFDSNVRYLLLDNLAESYASEPSPRIKRVANFLLWYANHFNRLTSGSNDRLWREYLETQRWVALAFIDPESAAMQFAECLQQTVTENDIVTRLQLGGLAASLSAPLAGYSHLLNYASALQTLETNDWNTAKEKFGDFLKRKITIGEVELLPIAEIAGESISTEAAEIEAEKEDSDFEIEIIGKSKPMGEIRHLISNFAQSDVPILITGEAGTGKELIARAIHQNSNRRKVTFGAINCRTLNKNDFESELFGYEKGTFTTSTEQKKGKFELLDGGTLFLEEIEKLPLFMQLRFLSVLPNGEFLRVGGTEWIKTDVRVISATNRNLKEETEKGTFREDLFYRLSAVKIDIPPLRERKDDIPLLAEHFIKKHNDLSERKIIGLSDEALQILMKYDWNGNVRELKQVIELAIVRSSFEWVLPGSLPEYILENTKMKTSYDYDVFISYSHRDNAALSGEEDGWVDYFHKALYQYLTGKLGRTARIWRDNTKMRGDSILSQPINEAITNSFIFLPILSPNYLSSEWCLEELEAFENQTNISQQMQSRIFPIVKTFIAGGLPQIINNLLKFNFYYVSRESRESDSFEDMNPAFGGLSREMFFTKVNDLSLEISEFIRSFEDKSPTTKTKDELPAIYLAAPSSDLENHYYNIQRDLKERIYSGQLNYRILPEFADTPGDAEIYARNVRENIRKSSLVIHLIGEKSGAYPINNSKSYQHIETEVAAERDGEPGFSRLIWTPRYIESTDSRHQNFIRQVINTNSAGVEIFQDSLEDFKTRIIEKLENKPPPPPRRDYRFRIFVICEKSDLEAVEKLKNYIYKLGFEVFLSNHFENDAINYIKAQREYLTLCDAVMIYWNYASLPWVRTNIDIVSKFIRMSKNHNILASAVFCDGDLNVVDKSSFRAPPPPNLDKINGFPELDSFFEKLAAKIQSDKNYQ